MITVLFYHAVIMGSLFNLHITFHDIIDELVSHDAGFVQESHSNLLDDSQLFEEPVIQVIVF